MRRFSLALLLSVLLVGSSVLSYVEQMPRSERPAPREPARILVYGRVTLNGRPIEWYDSDWGIGRLAVSFGLFEEKDSYRASFDGGETLVKTWDCFDATPTADRQGYTVYLLPGRYKVRVCLIELYFRNRIGPGPDPGDRLRGKYDDSDSPLVYEVSGREATQRWDIDLQLDGDTRPLNWLREQRGR